MVGHGRKWQHNKIRMAWWDVGNQEKFKVLVHYEIEEYQTIAAEKTKCWGLCCGVVGWRVGGLEKSKK